MSTRRAFLASTFAAGLCAALRPAIAAGRPPRILLRSSWQTVNIGDIGHTPGVLTLLERHLPDAEVRLWPISVGDGVEEMLRKRFPKVAIVTTRDDIRAAIDECDFLLHGSGPSLVAESTIVKWRQETTKPYGVYGITLNEPEPQTIEVLSGARFVFFRDWVSLRVAKEHGCKSPVMAFGPDGAFGVDLRHDEAATKFMHEHGLEEGKFLCVIPRLRYTPYWRIKNRAIDPQRHARNEAMKEHDHAPLREAIIAVTRHTPMQILVCPEDASQMATGKEMLVDPLPADVRKKVVWRESYWLTDEAVSTYVRSAGLFGNEMHSPIMCIGNGVPAVVCRFQEQTSKGLMWRDIGLGDWLFDHDNPDDVRRIAPTVLAIARDPAAAKAKAAAARAFVEQRQRETMAVVGSALG